MVVVISPPNETYVKSFDELAFHLRAILPKRQIHHVGSTAVPGLAGKNIIDILVSARNIHDIAAIKHRLQKLIFSLGRIATLRTATYLWRRGAKKQAQATSISISHDDFLLVRDYLRTHPEETKAYAAAKSVIVRDMNGDRSQYKLRKSKYVTELLGRARRWKYNHN